jgi:hypothetical protein
VDDENDNITLSKARQNVLNALNGIVLTGNSYEVIEAANLLLSREFPAIEAGPGTGKETPSVE